MFVVEGNKIVTLSGDFLFVAGETYEILFENDGEYVVLDNGEKRIWSNNGHFKKLGWSKVKFIPHDNNIILIENAE